MEGSLGYDALAPANGIAVGDGLWFLATRSKAAAASMHSVAVFSGLNPEVGRQCIANSRSASVSEAASGSLVR
jgi:hypothetical protein